MMNFDSTYALHTHFIFLGATIAGFILLITWGTKALNKDQLKTLTIWLLVIGILGTVLTANWGWGTWNRMIGGWGDANYQGMYYHMIDDDHEDINTAEEWREHMIEEMDEYMGFSE